MPETPRPSVFSRRSALALGLFALAGTATLSGCKSSATVGSAADFSTPLPSTVPSGTVLRVADQYKLLQSALELSGQLENVPYKIQWSAFTSGPAILEAFEGTSVDVGFIADAPILVAQAAGRPIKIVGAVQGSKSASRVWSAPGSGITSGAQLRGKSIAFTEGTTLEVAALQLLRNNNLTASDVTFVKLSTPADILSAVGTGRADTGVLTEPLSSKFAGLYGPKGAVQLTDDKNLTSGLQFLITRDAVDTSDATAAALRDLVTRFTKAELWLGQHQQDWEQGYYVEVEQVSLAQAQTVVAAAGIPSIPSYAAASAELQQVADLLTEYAVLPKKLDVAEDFDDRFDAVQQAAVASVGD